MLEKVKDIEEKEIFEKEVGAEEILYNPLLNKGMAFTQKEREKFHLDGLLPYSISTIETQLQRCRVHFLEKRSPLEKYLFLTDLQNRNEVLFYRFLSQYPEEMLPIIYTPTVGEAALLYSRIYRQHRGIYFSYPLRDRIEEIVNNIPNERIAVMVVTDGERILGLGDLGVQGMAIPVGKLSLYTLFGGIHPATTLPVVIDVGTNNPKLLSDPLYMGWRHERICGEEYQDFIHQILQALTKRYPRILIQWEDFSKQNAQPLLNKYRGIYCSFNDDIQGTAGVVVAGLLTAMKRIQSTLEKQRIVLFGFGSAGWGIARLLIEAFKKEGISGERAKENIYVLGKKGLAHSASKDLDELKKEFAQPFEKVKKWKVQDSQNISLLEVVREVKPTILIGTSTQPKSFTEEVVKEMKRYVDRPIIFPLSNPTSQTEAVPEDLIHWTEGTALIATGSPFPPVSYKTHMISIGQCNNVFIFPGVGLGVIASKTRTVTDSIFLKAAEVLSHFSSHLKMPFDALFPKPSQLRAISREIAISVAQLAVEEGNASIAEDTVEERIKKTLWTPDYCESS